MTVKYVDVVTGEVYNEKPKVVDFVGDGYVVRIIPLMRLVEVALCISGDDFVRIAELTKEWPVERPSDRIIFRGWRMNGKVNVFLDWCGD